MTAKKAGRTAWYAAAVAGLALAAGACGDKADTTLPVDLSEWSVQPAAPEVKAGTVKVVARNRSGSMVHELVVLALKPDGQKDPVAEIEDIAAGKSGEQTVKLAPGEYELACLITPGDAGSTMDHYQQGMRARLVVK